MKLNEYFKLPASQRLNRRAVALQLSSFGLNVTPETVGNWASSNKVPKKWQSTLTVILTSNADIEINIELS
ncbi:MAG: hypothetical protein KAS93_08190 [Gammaproteobacteria bacterium]|nr:hypothetical protein [Gammaproteobacteria bacterium]